MRKISFLLGLSVLVLLTSCATIIHGSRQDVSIASNPSSAVVSIDGVEVGRTPLTTELSRKGHHAIKIELDGYMPFETQFTRKVDGWIAGNILFGGLIGLAVDAISGGMYKLTPEQLQAELRNGTARVNKTDKGMYFAVVLEPGADWEKVGQLVRLDN